MSTRSHKAKKPSAPKKSKSGGVEILAGKQTKGEKSAKSTLPKITDAEVDAAGKDAPIDDLDKLGYDVMVSGSLPKAFCSIVVKKTGVRASSSDSAIARFVQELAGQFKKPELFAIDSCNATATQAPRAPRLPFQKSEKDAAKEPSAVGATPLPAAAAAS